LFKYDWFKLMGRGLNLQMMAFLKASMLEVYGTKMIVIFWPLKLGRSSICQTRFGKKWQVVQTFEHKHLYNVSQTEAVQYNAPTYLYNVSQTEAVQYNSPTYQEDGYCEEEGM
jgi:hypothetical protein